MVPYRAPCNPCLFYESAVLGLKEVMATQLHLYLPIPGSEYFVFILMTCNITNYSFMSLNVTITQPITLYLLEQYSIPLKPVLGP